MDDHHGLGSSSASGLSVASSNGDEDPRNEACAALLCEARLIFIGWGSGIRLQEVIQGSSSPRRNQGGLPICDAVLVGTSAGPAPRGGLVIAPANGPVGVRGGLDDGPRREYAGVPLDQRTELQVWSGFGWLPGFGVEAHLAEWNRYGHLLLSRRGSW